MDNSIYDPIFGSLISNDSTSRKLYFSSKENRMNFKINENQVWNFDFFNSYIDFNKITVKLPGLFEIGVLQYWDGQPFRYVCKARDSSAVFFVVIFQLVEVKDEINEKNSIQNKENLIPEGIKSENNIISTPIFLKDQQKYSG
ncbi:11654_t:CDS:2, partial [Scutellospora calospora]